MFPHISRLSILWSTLANSMALEYQKAFQELLGHIKSQGKLKDHQ